jgi:outer membrane protein insertion porin family
LQPFKAVLVCIGMMAVALMLAAGVVISVAAAQTSPSNDSGQSRPSDSGSAKPSSGGDGSSSQLALPTAAAPSVHSTTMPSAVSGYFGLPVREIHFRGINDEARAVEHLREVIAQKPKEPLDRGKIRRSIQALYATGRFADIQVEAQRAPDNQVSLVFIAKENLFIGPISVTGMPKRPTRSQLINASKLQMGELYTREKIERAIQGMKNVLADNGYYRAIINETEDARPENLEILIRFEIIPGEQAHVGTFTIEGDPGFTQEEIQRIADFHPGNTANADHVTKGLQRLRKKYQKEDRLEAQVAFTSRVYRPETNTVDYKLRIDRGPTVDIHLRGAKMRKGKIKKYVPVYEESAVDEDLLNEGRRNLRDYFQTQGYFDVEVQVKQEKVDSHRHIYYQVERSQKHRLLAVALEGNKSFPAEIIRERMQIQPSGRLLIQGRFSQNLLSRDITAIENLYKENGFEQVKVTSEVQDDYGDVPGHMRVVIHVNEGPQTRIASLEIAGNQAVTDQEIRDRINASEGQAYSDSILAGDREAVLNFYFNLGFPHVSFESTAKPLPGEPTRMNVTYTVREGEQFFVDRILVSGMQNTRPSVVHREFRIRAGDPLSQAKMLDTQGHLYDLGLFTSVNMAVQNPEGAAKYKNLLFDVHEARRWTITYGLGVEVQTGSQPVDLKTLSQQQGVSQPSLAITLPPPQGRTGASPRVSFDVTRLNFRGRDHTIFFKSRVGRLQQRALISYEAPHWFNKDNLALTINAFFDSSRDVRTFTSDRLEASVSTTQELSKITRLLYRFSYRRVRVDPATLVIDPDLIPLFSKPVRLGMPSLTYIRDKRDNPLETTKGNYTTGDFGVAAGFFGSEASFGRFLVQNSTYQLFRKKWVFARSTRIGIEEPFGSSTLVPLPERYFAGGGNSHRGFAINQAGPRDLATGFPVGGNAMFLNNLEVRSPAPLLPFVQNNMSFALFIDSGNVFTSTEEMWSGILRWTQQDKEGCQSVQVSAPCNFNYLSHAVGAGVRYRTPIGPVRVDFGYNLNPPVFPVRGGTTPHIETLKRFNFYFSIGQTF